MPDQRRPYRSHKVPACDRCRRFKRRCTGGTPDRPCVLCHLQEVPCLISAKPKAQAGARRSSRREQRRVLPKPTPSDVNVAVNAAPSPVDADIEQDERIGTDYHGSPTQDRSKIELSMVASPVISEDIQILERYMSSKASKSMPVSVDGSLSHAGAANPMVYLRVPRRREGLAMSENPGKQQKEILRQILKPYADELVRLYFDEIHPAFPMLDRQSFLELYRSGDKLSPALTCEFFALSLILWRHSPTLRQFPKPDSQFIWNLAVEALQQDFLAPGLSTVFAVVLDMMGRPVYSVLGNTINNGRAVTLAQTLGLNRDPTKWKRPASEKALRIRLWWAVLIHDRWSSFAHGIPPIVTKGQHDVPVPLPLDILSDADSEKHSRAAECFMRLCTLTNILGEVLPLAYHLDVDQKQIWRQIRRLELELCEWEDNLPSYLQPNSDDQSRALGASSLRLGYLSVRLLLNRIALHAATLSSEIDRSESTRYHLSQLRRSAHDIVEYVCSLTKAQLQEFWLPYTAHHLILTVIILLRCTVESTDKTIISACKSGLSRLWTKLHDAAERDGWDLASICISQCGDSVSKILNNASEVRGVPKEQPDELHCLEDVEDPSSVDLSGLGISGNGMSTDLLPDILPFSNPDLSFDNQWDVGPWYGLGWMDIDNISYEGVNQGLFM